MPGNRSLLAGWTRSSNRFSGNQKEVYTLLGDEESMTSQKVDEKPNVTHSKMKLKRSVRIGQHSLKIVCNNLPFIGHVLLRITGNERMSIYSLKDGLLAQVYRHLTLVDQVCLALSCKKAFSQYMMFVKDNSILLSQPTDCCLPLSFVHSGDKLRKELFVRLENSRWAYCEECLVLKPRKLFTQDELKAPSRERCCKQYDGIIELCSCLYLTRRDRKNILDLLRSPTTNLGVRYGPFGFKSEGELIDGYVCPFRSNSGRKVEVYTKFSISRWDKLVSEVWYVIRWSSSDPFLAAMPVFACPHLDLIPLAHVTGDYTECYSCLAGIWRVPRSFRGADSVTFHVLRLLGSDKKENLFWNGSCRDPRTRSEAGEQNKYRSAVSHK